MARRMILGAVLFAAAVSCIGEALPLRPFAPAPAYAAATGFVGLTPARLLDTRDGTGAPAAAVGPTGVIDLQVTGRGGVPVAGVAAIVLNVTVVSPSANSYVTVWPSGQPRPVASNLNFVPGQTVPNLVITKVGAGGRVSLFNNAGTVHLVADVSGYYTDGSQLVPTVPARLLDTRNGTGGITGPTSGVVSVPVLGQAGVPGNATSVVLNVTVTEPSSDGYLTVWPAGSSQPTASNLNFIANQTVPNLVIAKIGTEGKISYYASVGRVQVIIDVLGYTADPTSLTTLLDPVGQSSYVFSEVTVAAQGQSRFNSIQENGLCDKSSPEWEEYNLGRQWATLATTFTFDDAKSNATAKVRFRILGDGAVLTDQTVSFGQAMNVTVNVANVLRVRFEVLNVAATGCSSYPSLLTPVLAR